MVNSCTRHEVAKQQAMSLFHVQDELPSPLQKRQIDDGDSGFHELIDDAATFELLPTARRSSSPFQVQLQSMQSRNHVAHSPANNISDSSPEYSPVSPSPRIVGNESVSSNVSTNTQPDGGMPPAATVEQGESSTSPGATFMSPSPTGSEEDVSEKGEQCEQTIRLVKMWLEGW